MEVDCDYRFIIDNLPDPRMSPGSTSSPFGNEACEVPVRARPTEDADRLALDVRVGDRAVLRALQLLSGLCDRE